MSNCSPTEHFSPKLLPKEKGGQSWSVAIRPWEQPSICSSKSYLAQIISKNLKSTIEVSLTLILHSHREHQEPLMTSMRTKRISRLKNCVKKSIRSMTISLKSRCKCSTTKRQDLIKSQILRQKEGREGKVLKQIG